MVTHMGRGVFLAGQPRHCICTNASRGLSAIGEFLVVDPDPCGSFREEPSGIARARIFFIGRMPFLSLNQRCPRSLRLDRQLFRLPEITYFIYDKGPESATDMPMTVN